MVTPLLAEAAKLEKLGGDTASQARALLAIAANDGRAVRDALPQLLHALGADNFDQDAIGARDTVRFSAVVAQALAITYAVSSRPYVPSEARLQISLPLRRCARSSSSVSFCFSLLLFSLTGRRLPAGISGSVSHGRHGPCAMVRLRRSGGASGQRACQPAGCSRQRPRPRP